MAAKGIVKGIITAAVICGLGAGGYGLYKHFGGTVSTSSDKVFVQKVATLNTVDGANLFAHNFSGVIVAQKTVDVKYDPEKTIGEILVENGDTVKKGDKLMTYDVEKIQVDIDSAKLEIERLKTEIETFKSEIEQYEQEKKTAVGDAAITCTTNILSKKSSIAKNEYDIKTKEADVTKLEKTLENAFVTAPIDGTVKDIKDSGSTQNPMDMYGYNNQPQSNDVLLKIAAAGNYRVKGVFNEQNSAQIHPGAKVLLRSRIDDSLVLHGEVSEIDSSPETNNQSDYYMPMDEQNTSAKYAFYVEPESLDGFMLGQHILIEMDNGQEDTDKKQGLWIYSSFVLWDGDRTYVWAKNSKDQIEKRYIEIGTVNDEAGDCEILSGLTIDDYIAFPSDYIEPGMAATTNQSDKNIPENVINELPGEGNVGDDMGMPEGKEEFGFPEGAEIPEGAEFPEGAEIPEGTEFPAENGADEVQRDEDGNMIFDDGSGNVLKFDEDGNLIEGGDQLFGDEKAKDASAAN